MTQSLDRKPLLVLAHPLVAMAVIIAAALSLVGGLLFLCQRIFRRGDNPRVEGVGSAMLSRRQQLNDPEFPAD
jgi:hypothetical protein